MPIRARHLAARSAFLLAAAAVLLAAPARAQSSGVHSVSVEAGHGRDSSWIASRVPLARAAANVVTRDGQVAVLLLDTAVVLQFTDAGLAAFHQTMHDSLPAGIGSRLVARMLGSAMTEMFDHGVAIPLSSVREARMDGDRLVFEGRDGGRLFEHVDVNGRDVMASFAPGDAERFAARVNRALAR